MNLKEQLSNWDGKSTDYLGNLYDLIKSDSTFVDQLFDVLAEENLQTAATWLVKHALENGVLLDQSQTYEFYSNADALATWQARLHLLQIMPMLRVPEELRYKLAKFCRFATEDENKFVRAWGYNGLYELANLYHEFRDGLDVVISSAMETEPASIKARLRNIKKNINANWQ